MPFTGKHDFVEESAQPKGKTAKKNEKAKDEKAKDEKSKPESDKAK